jgi:hypothetical protein
VAGNKHLPLFDGGKGFDVMDAPPLQRRCTKLNVQPSRTGVRICLSKLSPNLCANLCGQTVLTLSPSHDENEINLDKNDSYVYLRVNLVNDESYLLNDIQNINNELQGDAPYGMPYNIPAYAKVEIVLKKAANQSIESNTTLLKTEEIVIWSKMFRFLSWVLRLICRQK